MRKSVLRYIEWSLAALLAIGARHASAGTRAWTGGESSWDNPAAWNPSGTPLHNDSVLIDQAGGNVTYANSAGTVQLFPSFDLGASGAGASLVQAQNTLRVGLMTVGNVSKGTFDHSGGTVSVENPMGLILGASSGAQGIYQLSSSGVLNVTNYLSVGELGSGTFTQSGGTLSMSGGGAVVIGGNSGSTGAYTLSAGSIDTYDLQLSPYGGNASMTQSGGSATIAHDLMLGDPTSTLGGPATYTHTGGAITTANLAIGRSGTFKHSGGTLVTKTVTIDLAGGKLDLKDGAMAVNYDGSSTLAALTGYIANAFHDGAWDRPGITMSTPSSTMRIGIGEAATLLGLSGTQTASWRGMTVDATSVLMAYTLGGDANLDGTVNFFDLTALAGNYGTSGANWERGDFNYDGVVNFFDLTVLAGNYGGPLPAEPFMDGPIAANVPEPSALGLLLLVCAPVLMRRKRR